MADFLTLLAHFHLESALLAALTGCFWAGWSGARHRTGDASDFRRATRILSWIMLAGVPLLALDVIWGCFSFHGAAFWLLYPVPSVYFGYAVGRLVRRLRVSVPRFCTVVLLLLVGVGVLLLEFFTLPQVYFYNHVWGGWPGPLYDEVVEVNGSLLYFRMLTAAWILLLWNVPEFSRRRLPKLITVGAAMLLALGYASLAEMGVVTPEQHIRETLGGRHDTEHFRLYYDRGAYSEFEVGLHGSELEFHLSEVADTLALDRETFDVGVYLYAHAWQKKELTGAKFTSYVPVWLEHDQLHVARQQMGSLRHELVHVAAKRFGNSVTHASWSIGLVEGLAVALAPDPLRRSTPDQLVAADPPYPDAERVRDSFSFWGFYGGRSALNYTTSGSFVGHLLRIRPVGHFKQAYRTSNLPGAYPEPLDSLVAGWHRHLAGVEIDSTDRERADRLFSIPSLLERECPHVRSPGEAAWDRYRRHTAARDTLRAIAALDDLVAYSDSALPVMAEWSFRNLQEGNGEKVRRAAGMNTGSAGGTAAELQMLFADASLLAGDTLAARRHLERARLAADSVLSGSPAGALALALDTRTSPLQWNAWLDLVYRGRYPDAAGDTLMTRTLVRALERAMDREEWSSADRLAGMLGDRMADEEYLDTCLRLIHLLAYRGEAARAETLIQTLDTLPALNAAARERLDLERRWLRYLKNKRIP